MISASQGRFSFATREQHLFDISARYDIIAVDKESRENWSDAMTNYRSQHFLNAEISLKTYEVRGATLLAEQRGGVYWIYDRWRDSLEWKVHGVANGLTKQDVIDLGITICPGHG